MDTYTQDELAKIIEMETLARLQSDPVRKTYQQLHEIDTDLIANLKLQISFMDLRIDALKDIIAVQASMLERVES